MDHLTHCPACKKFSRPQASGVRPCIHCGAPIFHGVDPHGAPVQHDCSAATILSRIVNLEAICPDITGTELGLAIFPDAMPCAGKERRPPRLVLAAVVALASAMIAVIIGIALAQLVLSLLP